MKHENCCQRCRDSSKRAARLAAEACEDHARADAAEAALRELKDALRLAIDGKWTALGDALMDDCGHVNEWAGNPGMWPLRCCAGCAMKALSAVGGAP